MNGPNPKRQKAARRLLASVDFKDIESHYDELEHSMLDSFYTHIRRFQGTKFVHWNMRNSNYGFAALEHRFKVLGRVPWTVPDDNKIDLAATFLTGNQEAEAFERRDFVGLHQSTLRKVDIMASLFQRCVDRQLKTNTSWWEMNGGSIRGTGHWMVANPAITFILAVVGIVIGILGIWWPKHS